MKKIIFVLCLIVLSISYLFAGWKNLNTTGYYQVRWFNNNNMHDFDDNKNDRATYLRTRVHLNVFGNLSENVYTRTLLRIQKNMVDNRNAVGNRAAFATTLRYSYLRLDNVLTNDLSLTMGRMDYILGNGSVLYDDGEGIDGVKFNYKQDNYNIDGVWFILKDATNDSGATTEHYVGLVGNYEIGSNNIGAYFLHNKERTDGKDNIDRYYKGVNYNGLFMNNSLNILGEYNLLSGKDKDLNKKYDGYNLYGAIKYTFKDYNNLFFAMDYMITTGQDSPSNKITSWTSNAGYGYGIADHGDISSASASDGLLADEDINFTGFAIGSNIIDNLSFTAKYYDIKKETGGSLGYAIASRTIYRINPQSTLALIYDIYSPDKGDTARYANLTYVYNF